MKGFDFTLICLSLSGWVYLFLGRPELSILSFGIALAFGLWRRHDIKTWRLS